MTDFDRSLDPILEQMQAWASVFEQRKLAAEAGTCAPGQGAGRSSGRRLRWLKRPG